MISSLGRDRVWLVVKKLSIPDGTRGHLLRTGDLIKFGRVKLQVKQIYLPNEHSDLMVKSVEFTE